MVLLVLVAARLAAQTPVPELLERRTLERLRDFERRFDGVIGVAAFDLQSGRRLALNGDSVFPTASVIKLAILATIYDRKLPLDRKITVNPADLVDGSAALREAASRGVSEFTVRGLMLHMIRVSDNTATNKLIELTGMEAVNDFLKGRGFTQTKLRRRMMDSAAAARDEENVSTPNEMARLVELIARGKLAGSEEMTGLMKQVSGGFKQGLPDIESASKTGTLPGVRAEAGIIYLPHRPFVLSVFSTFIDDRTNPVPEVTRLVYGMYERLARANSFGRGIR